ncbi:MAG TPA: hypothetical protein VFO73_12020 [Candidatus Limnocylindrales bacterium]|nr:hypothetical protein [Candidatus Limnocylindrales bacterium]
MRTVKGSSGIVRLTGRAIALMAVATLVAACWAAGATRAPTVAARGASATPGSTPTPTGGSAGMPGCPNFVEVVETGPMPGDNGAEDGPVAREQNRLQGDVEAAQEYGAAHPDEFASLRFENGPRVRIVIAFTGHIAEHCAALRELLSFPDDFELILEERTEADLQAIQQEIVSRAGPFLVSAASGGATGVVEVGLRANGEGMARQIVEQYGDAVHVTVGLLSYPDRTRADGMSTCAPAMGTLRLDAPLRGTLVLESPSVSSGADFGATVRVVNVGIGDFDFESGAPATALVYAPGGNEAIGTFAGGISGVGLSQVLGPLDSVDVDVLGGTASCDPALGYALPPGQYEVRAVIDVLTMHDNAPTEIEYILSDPAPLTINP